MSKVTVPVIAGRSAITAALQALRDLDISVDDIALRRPTLDEVFLKLTGSPASPATAPGRSVRPSEQERHEPRTRGEAMTTIPAPASSDTDARRPARSARTAGLGATVSVVGVRTLRKYMRTPQLLVSTVVGGAMFMILFRFIFGGSIHSGTVPYVDFLIPGMVLTSVLITGTGAARVSLKTRTRTTSSASITTSSRHRARRHGRRRRSRWES